VERLDILPDTLKPLFPTPFPLLVPKILTEPPDGVETACPHGFRDFVISEILPVLKLSPNPFLDLSRIPGRMRSRFKFHVVNGPSW
jgi:hypothetical protein